MTQLEEAIRVALRSRASEIRPPLPPLNLRPTHAWGRNPRVAYLRWTSAQLRWLAPAFAVIAVLAVIAGTLLSRGAEQTPRKSAGAQLETGSGDIETSVPPYYVALVADHTVNARATGVATVRNTMTGHVLARVRAPAPYAGFIKVSGATDDRTFALLAAGAPNQNGMRPERFYLLHIDPQAAPWPGYSAQLTALPATDIPGSQQVDAMTLSPNGADLAAILQNGVWNYLYVYNVLTGKTRVWTRQLCGKCGPTGLYVPPGGVSAGAPALSWSLNSATLAFIPSTGYSQLRLLNLSGPGDNVQPDSTVLQVRGVPVASWTWAAMAPNGKTVFVGYIEARGQSLWYGVGRYSAATGRFEVINKLTIFNEGRSTPYSYLNQIQESADDVAWTSYDGGEAVVLNAGPGQSSAGIYSGSHYKPIPWRGNVVDAAW